MFDEINFKCAHDECRLDHFLYAFKLIYFVIKIQKKNSQKYDEHSIYYLFEFSLSEDNHF